MSPDPITSHRNAGPEDAPATAAVHVAGWQFAYRSILPEPFLDSLRPENRKPRHRKQVAAGDTV